MCLTLTSGAVRVVECTRARALIQVELAMVQEAVSNPVIGKMRMQFWRDAVKSIADVRSLPLTDRPGTTYDQVDAYMHGGCN